MRIFWQGLVYRKIILDGMSPLDMDALTLEGESAGLRLLRLRISMSKLRQRAPRLKLDSKDYRLLCEEVLKRDGWRCQMCGSLRNLQVHHKEFRSRLGDDSAQNLITLCVDCHRTQHIFEKCARLSHSSEN